MPFITGEPIVARFLSQRDTMLPRGPLREHISELMVKHGANIRTPEHLSRHIGFIVLPFLEDLIHRLVAGRGTSLATE